MTQKEPRSGRCRVLKRKSLTTTFQDLANPPTDFNSFRVFGAAEDARAHGGRLRCFFPHLRDQKARS